MESPSWVSRWVAWRPQNKRAEKPYASLPLITVIATASPLMCRLPPIAYVSYSLAMLPIFSKVPYTLISVNRLNSAAPVVSIHPCQRTVKLG